MHDRGDGQHPHDAFQERFGRRASQGDDELQRYEPNDPITHHGRQVRRDPGEPSHCATRPRSESADGGVECGEDQRKGHPIRRLPPHHRPHAAVARVGPKDIQR